MMHRGKEVMVVLVLANILKELGRDLFSVVGDNLLRVFIVEDPLFTNFLATSAAENPFMGTILGSLVKWYDSTKIYWFPLADFNN